MTLMCNGIDYSRGFCLLHPNQPGFFRDLGCPRCAETPRKSGLLADCAIHPYARWHWQEDECPECKKVNAEQELIERKP